MVASICTSTLHPYFSLSKGFIFRQFPLQLVAYLFKILVLDDGEGSSISLMIFLPHPGDNPIGKLVFLSTSPFMTFKTYPDNVSGIESCGHTVTFEEMVSSRGKFIASRRPAKNIPLDYDLLNEGVAVLLYAQSITSCMEISTPGPRSTS